MITFGYVKDTRYTGDGTLMIKVRIPSMHGPNSLKEYKGKPVRNYVYDDDLPYYPSLLLPHLPTTDEVVALSTTDDSTNQFIVLGLTGGRYSLNITGP